MVSSYIADIVMFCLKIFNMCYLVRFFSWADQQSLFDIWDLSMLIKLIWNGMFVDSVSFTGRRGNKSF